jgi:hypothetical protein
MENGLMPNAEKLVGPMIRNICYANAEQYMAFPMRATTAGRRRSPARAKK